MNTMWLWLIGAGATAALAAGILVWWAFDAAPDALQHYRVRFTRSTIARTSGLFLAFDPGTAFGINIMVILAGTAITWWASGSAVVALLCAAIIASLPRLLFAKLRRRRMVAFDAQLPDALMMLAGGMRAGLSLTGALQNLLEEAASPLRQEFGLILQEYRLGLPLESALQNLTRRMNTRTTVLVVAAMRVAHETGGGLAEALERISSTIRRQLQMEAKTRALTSQGRLQGWVVGAMPIALLLVLNFVDPPAMALMWHTPLGWFAMAIIAFLELCGALLIRRIVSIET